jgi:alkylated DNA repair protein (DNA oxidative demethylase)
MSLPRGLSYIAEFLSPDEQGSLLQEIRELHFTHDRFRGQQLKRRYAQFGYAYVSIGRKLLPAAPFPVFLTALIEKASPHTRVGTLFNQCIVTHYPKTAGIGWHQDADRFSGCIIAVSLAGTARLQFRPKGNLGPTNELLVFPGSLYIMTGSTRWAYEHRVIAVKSDRYSLTFRHVAEGRSPAS